jgi:hypothetical protein
MRRQVSSSHISESTAYQDVRSEMFFPSYPGEADSRREPVGTPLKPNLMGVPVSNNTCKREAGRGVS